MHPKLEKMRQERHAIAKSYSSSPIKNTHVDSEVEKRRMWQKVVIKEIINESYDTKSFILAPDNEAGIYELIPFKAGQYISLKLQIGESTVTRPYSLFSSPSLVKKDIYKITIKRVENGLVSNYMLDSAKVGDHLTVSMPIGKLIYNKVIDEDNVIGIAGGIGIAPFMSLASAVEEGIEDCNLTIIYSVKTYDDILFKDEILEYNRKSKKVKFIITITEEEKEGYNNGRITKELLEPFIKEFNTILMCGPKSLYLGMNDILNEFHIPKKNVKFDLDYPYYRPAETKVYDLKVILKNDFILADCRSDESLLVAMERAHISVPSLCRVGTCGFCRSILLEGKLKQVGGTSTNAEITNDYIHPCVCYPESDIVLRIDI